MWAGTHPMYCPLISNLACKKIRISMKNIKENHYEYSLTGTGEQSIVFLNGFRMKFDTWDTVCANIPVDYQLLLYNRSGVGASSKAKTRQTGDVIINELHELLFSLDIKPPHIFVAHSLGGIYANLYARNFPGDVAGVVFVDAPHPSEVNEQRRFKAPIILRAINEGLKHIEKWFDEFKYSEDDCIEETVLHIESAGPFPDIPIAVVTGIKKMPFVPLASFDIHLHYQAKLLELTDQSRQYRCSESGHFPQITEPVIVAKAIYETANDAKNRLQSAKPGSNTVDR
jgi:pimeloyl-ACP methyl ester carboxylesterase